MEERQGGDGVPGTRRVGDDCHSRVTEQGREAGWGWVLGTRRVGHDWQSRDRARKRGRVGVGYPRREGVGHDCQSPDRAGKRGKAGGCGRYPVRGEAEDTVVRQRRGEEGPWMEGRGGAWQVLTRTVDGGKDGSLLNLISVTGRAKFTTKAGQHPAFVNYLQ